MGEYRTVQGDMWDGIAYMTMGSVAYTDMLMAANPEYLDYYIFPAGVVLKIPTPTAATPENLPPWKRVSS